MKKISEFINSKLNERISSSALRVLPLNNNLVDFCSNDYLGFSKSDEIRTAVNSQLKILSNYPAGSTGSRLISGNTDFIENLEQSIAGFHQFECALIFNSGYDANVGLFSCLPQRGDTILLDEFVHASIIDGARLSHANRYTFKHNDLGSLESKLKVAKGNIFIGVESVYSMDGDEAPLLDIIKLSEQYGAGLIVDEAHAIGIFGENGRGLITQYNLQSRVLAQVVTFGKSLGCHGAAVLCDQKFKQYLINFARSFIYTTAAAFHTHLSVKVAYEHLARFNGSFIHDKVSHFKAEAGELYDQFVPSRSPIQCMIVEGNYEVKNLASKLQEKGFDVRAILHPTVPRGRERLRICLHTFNTNHEISNLVQTIKSTI